MKRQRSRSRLAYPVPAALLLAVLITQCGSGTSSAPEPTAGPPPAVGTVKVGISPDWEPWESIDPQTQKPVGFDVDLMQAIAKEAGFQVEFVQVPFEDLLNGVGTDYQAAISAILMTDERAGKVAFSDDYQKTGLVLVVPSWNRAVWGITDVAGKKAGAIAGSPAETEIKNVDPAALVAFDDYDAMFAALTVEERTLDVIVCEYLVAREYMAKTPGVLKSGAAFTTDKLAIAVDKSEKDILAAINAGLKSAQDNYLVKDVITDWLDVPPEKRPEGFVLHEGR